MLSDRGNHQTKKAEISEDFTNLIALTFYDDEPWNGIVKGQSQSREASQSEVKIYDA
jgi:hypothetical protein